MPTTTKEARRVMVKSVEVARERGWRAGGDMVVLLEECDGFEMASRREPGNLRGYRAMCH